MYYQLSTEVRQAVEEGRGVVALESTIISHGMPYPRNVETAREVESVVREAGAIPATIAILDGVFHVGLGPDELERLGTDKNVMKASRRDVPIATALKLTAATTVATTMIGAAAAGIPVFATGGVGGVHRGVESTMDVSADLQEFTKTNVAVVSAGVKAILDIPRTLEYLETLGVPVLGYGTDAFPAFYSRDSGSPVHYRVESPEQVAAILHDKWSMHLDGGVLIANPIPEEAALEFAYMEGVIANALESAKSAGVHGKDVTPYLLARIVELTGGESLEANIALVKNNARVAAAIATALAAIRRGHPGLTD
jgi:pseudouridine-5'-phosphate glycosidase